MEIIERLETLRIPESEFFGISEKQQYAYQLLNDRLDDCLEIVWKWLQEKDLLNE